MALQFFFLNDLLSYTQYCTSWKCVHLGKPRVRGYRTTYLSAIIMEILLIYGVIHRGNIVSWQEFQQFRIRLGRLPGSTEKQYPVSGKGINDLISCGSCCQSVLLQAVYISTVLHLLFSNHLPWLSLIVYRRKILSDKTKKSFLTLITNDRYVNRVIYVIVILNIWCLKKTWKCKFETKKKWHFSTGKKKMTSWTSGLNGYWEFKNWKMNTKTVPVKFWVLN